MLTISTRAPSGSRRSSRRRCRGELKREVSQSVVAHTHAQRVDAMTAAQRMEGVEGAHRPSCGRVDPLYRSFVCLGWSSDWRKRRFRRVCLRRRSGVWRSCGEGCRACCGSASLLACARVCDGGHTDRDETTPTLRGHKKSLAASSSPWRTRTSSPRCARRWRSLC